VSLVIVRPVVMANKAFSRLARILRRSGESGSEEPLLEQGVTRLEKFAHFWVLVFRSFFRNRCPLRASALSYASLLALIPMLAVILSVTSSLLKSEGEERIYEFIDKAVANVMPPATIEEAAPVDEDDWLFGDTAVPQQVPQTNYVTVGTNTVASTNA